MGFKGWLLHKDFLASNNELGSRTFWDCPQWRISGRWEIWKVLAFLAERVWSVLKARPVGRRTEADQPQRVWICVVWWWLWHSFRKEFRRGTYGSLKEFRQRFFILDHQFTMRQNEPYKEASQMLWNHEIAPRGAQTLDWAHFIKIYNRHPHVHLIL